MTKAHDNLVVKQFGARAEAYVTSAVHASGEDLQQIAKLAAALKPAQALDLGCGGGHVSFNMSPHSGEVTAYDLSQQMLDVVAKTAAERGLKNIRTQQGKVEQLPFKDASFDFVATRYSAHHWHNVPRALNEARRVVRANGYAVFADTVAPEEPLLDTWLQSIELLRDPSHVRNYTSTQWLGMLKAAGFKTTEPVIRPVRLEFASWVARMATPEVNVRAIRALQAAMPKEGVDHFAVAEDGSFTISSLTVEVTPV
jgi:ubiquinone/menaquinone biosynthesis C-methylase UbiE